MHYYQVWVASQRYHSGSPLTYAFDSNLTKGVIVIVPLQQQKVLGVITEPTTKPKFTTKTIQKAYTGITLPPELLSLVPWLHKYYPSPFGQLISLFLPTVLKNWDQKPVTLPNKVKPAVDFPPLTSQQQTVVRAIARDDSRMHLLHGDTGSGKTRVYLELIREQLALNRSSILLTPEIGLTPQLLNQVEQMFAGHVVVLHSELPPAQRRQRWLQIAHAQKPLIVIGPRSALFAPLRNIGLIIIDEAHDSAYKQEQSPHYLTNRVAAKLAEFHAAKVLLGSATPTINDYYIFKSKNLPIHRLSQPAIKSSYKLEIDVVNIRHREEFVRSSWLSDTLLKGVDEALNNGSQSLLFLNRRGTARLVICQNCEWQALCPNCDLPLTYHADTYLLLCHTCGHKQSVLTSCPVCKASDITFKGIGTKSIASEIQKLYPKAVIMRFDSDNKKSEKLEQHYEDVHRGKIDILVGTQLLVKGLDLPRLGFVGIIAADSSLYFPDFTAEERTYQLVSQVIGRVNRGHRSSKITIQTYHPDNESIVAAINNTYDVLYQKQLNERQQFNFPPFRHVLKVRIERASQKSTINAIERIKMQLKSLKLPVEIIGPAPAFTEKSHGKYRWQLVIKAKQRDYLLKVIERLPAQTPFDIDPLNLL